MDHIIDLHNTLEKYIKYYVKLTDITIRWRLVTVYRVLYDVFKKNTKPPLKNV